MSAVTLPQKAGFAPTVQEWDQLVRIAENLAAQLAQAQASAVETARIVGAERDAARAEVARVTELAITERDSAAREIERLTAALAKSDPWDVYGTCVFCGGDYYPTAGEEFSKQHHSDCVWADAKRHPGQAQPAAPECDLCKIRAGLKLAMDIVEPLPEIGSDHYDQPLANAFNALDEAYGLFKHNEHKPAPAGGEARP